MMKTVEGKIEKIVMVRIDITEDIVTCLEEAIASHGIKNGIILNGFGAVFYYKGHEERIYEGLKDLNSLSGMIMEGRLHLHGNMSFNTEQLGGHIDKNGCRANFFVAVYIGVLGDETSLDNWDKPGIL